VDDGDREALTGAPSHTAYLLGRIAEEAQRARQLEDPLEQAKALALLVQPYAGWALREAVWDCRGRGMSWGAIGQEIGLSQAVLSRQARANGPVVTIAPYYGLDSRNADGQGPLRLAATSLVQRMTALAATLRDGHGVPVAKLYTAVMAMAHAQTTRKAEPLLTTAKEVLRQADALTADSGTPESATEAERDVWSALDELRTAVQRDQSTIRIADELNNDTTAQGE